MSHGFRPSGPRPYGFPPAIALATVAALLLAGCGGSSASARAKSRAIAQADAICAQVNARRNAANRQLGPTVTSAVLPKLARLAPGLAAYEHGAVVELRGLAVPSGLAADWRRILAGAEQIATNTVKLGRYSKANDLKAVEALVHEDQQSEQEVSTVASAAGFKHCGLHA
jgi:hypothetical protein